MKIEKRSRKRSHKLDGIRVGRIRTFPFSSDSAYDSVAYDLVKTRLTESEAEAEDLTNNKARIEHCDWLILPLLLATPTMQFSLDRKQRSHKRMRCCASDSVSLFHQIASLYASDYDSDYDSVTSKNQVFYDSDFIASENQP